MKNRNKYLVALTISFLLLLSIPFFFYPFAHKNYQLLLKKMPQFEQIEMLSKDSIKKQIQSDQYMFFNSNKIEYKTFESIYFTLGSVHKQLGTVTTNINPSITVYNDKGVLLKNIFDQDTFDMVFNTDLNVFEYQLYLKDNLYEGLITVVVQFKTDILNQPLEQKIIISIANDTDYELPYSYAFLGLDSKEILAVRKIISLNGKEIAFSQITNWFKLLNADAVMIPSAITKTFNLDNNIWDMKKLRESKALAKTFSQMGQDVALWIQALEIDGLEVEKYNYQLSEYTGEGSPKSIISLNDEQRKKELKAIMVDHLNDKNVDYIGFSKVFFGQYHGELKNKFINDFTIKDNDNFDAFNHWGYYQSVEYFRTLISDVKSEKPLFFIFTGQELSSNPQFLDMAFAVGVDFVFVDLEASLSNLPKQLALINKNKALQKYRDRIILSYCLDYNNLIQGQGSAIDNWVNQNLNLFHLYNMRAIRIKDLYRAMFGNRGPYPAYEWVLAIGDLISQWKQSKRYYPLVQNYTANTSLINNEIELSIELKNISLNSISNINITLLPLIDQTNLKIFEYSELKVGEIFRTNIILSNITFKQSLLQRRTRFLGIKSRFTQHQSSNINREQIKLLSFIDPTVAQDQKLATEDEFNKQMRKLLQEDLQRQKEEEQKQRALSNKLAKEQRLKKLADEKKQKEKEGENQSEEED